MATKVTMAISKRMAKSTLFYSVTIAEEIGIRLNNVSEPRKLPILRTLLFLSIFR